MISTSNIKKNLEKFYEFKDFSLWNISKYFCESGSRISRKIPWKVNAKERPKTLLKWFASKRLFNNSKIDFSGLVFAEQLYSSMCIFIWVVL